MINNKTKKRLTLVLACSTLVTALSSCSIDEINKEYKNEDVNYDEEIHQILEENIAKCKEINDSKKEKNNESDIPDKTAIIYDTYISHDRFTTETSNININIYEYGEIINPLYFSEEYFINFLSDNNLVLGNEISNDIFKNVYNLDLSTFELEYSSGMYSSSNYILSDDELNMILIMKYNKYINDLYANNLLASSSEIENYINEYFSSYNIDLRWNEVPSKTNSYKRAYNSN